MLPTLAFTGQRNGRVGLDRGSTRFMEHIRDIRGDARHYARRRAVVCRSEKNLPLDKLTTVS